MRTTVVSLGVAIALTLGVGSAAAAGRTAGTRASADMHTRMTTDARATSPADMADMHNGSMMSGSMMSGTGMDAIHGQMRALLPAELRAACDAAHAQMSADGPGRPGTANPVAPGDHSVHHANS